MAIGTPVSLGTAVLASSSTTTIQLTVTGGAAVGDLVIVDVGNDGGANLPSGVTDSAGNTYTADVTGLRDADDYSFRRFSTVVTNAITSGVTTITGTVNGGGGTWDKIMCVAKVTGNWDSNRIDKTTSATGSSTSPDSGLTATTTVADELVYGCMAAGGGPTGATPLTAATNSNTILHNVQGGNFIDMATVYRIVSSTGTYRASGTWQFTDLWGCYVVTYKEAAGGATVERSAAVDATAAVTVASREFFTVFERSSAIAATGAITAVPQRERLRSAAIAATAAIAAAPQRERLRSAAVAATAAATIADHERDHLRTAALTAVSAIATIGEIEGAATEHEASASLDATAAITAAPQRELQRSSAATGTATITVTAYQRDRLRSAALAATTAISTAGEVDGVIVRSASLTATSAISATYQRELLRQTAIAATGLITTSPQRELLRQSAIAATAAITAAGFVGEQLEYPLNLEHTETARHATHTEHGAAITHTENTAITARA